MRRNVATGERVSLPCRNSAEAAVATLSIQAAGAVFCPMNPAYTERELRQIPTDCRPSVAVRDAACAPLVRKLGVWKPAPEAGIAHVVTDAAVGAAFLRRAHFSHHAPGLARCCVFHVGHRVLVPWRAAAVEFPAGVCVETWARTSWANSSRLVAPAWEPESQQNRRT